MAISDFTERRKTHKPKGLDAERPETGLRRNLDALWSPREHPSARHEIPEYCSTSWDDSSDSDHNTSPIAANTAGTLEDVSDGTQERRKRLEQMKQHHHEQSMRSLCPQEDAPPKQPLENSKSGSLTGLLGSFIEKQMGSYQGSVTSFNEPPTSSPSTPAVSAR